MRKVKKVLSLVQGWKGGRLGGARRECCWIYVGKLCWGSFAETAAAAARRRRRRAAGWGRRRSKRKRKRRQRRFRQYEKQLYRRGGEGAHESLGGVKKKRARAGGPRMHGQSRRLFFAGSARGYWSIVCGLALCASNLSRWRGRGFPPPAACNAAPGGVSVCC